MRSRLTSQIEWPTIGVLVGTYIVWGLSTTLVADFSVLIAIFVTAFAVAQFSSITHEVIHGHPTSNERVNAALVFPALAMIYPFARFRDTHLAHHLDCELTDPYDDPESNFLDAGDWNRLPVWLRLVYSLNNTLAGRLLFGPLIGTVHFIRSDWQKAATDPSIRRAWQKHALAISPVLIWVVFAPIPIWAYLVACYGGDALIRVRTFLEHQAHEKARGRTVIINDRGPLSFLFLNNNFHAVHHMHPKVSWYRLPQLYRRNATHYLRTNDGYFYKSYGEIFRQYLFQRKDPVPHPLWRR
ncbi:MAG: fatty acid desaturase [Boseongicola sp.]